MTSTERQHSDMLEVPSGYCPNQTTGVKLPAGSCGNSIGTMLPVR
jgi:hypothetical protein